MNNTHHVAALFFCLVISLHSCSTTLPAASAGDVPFELLHTPPTSTCGAGEDLFLRLSVTGIDRSTGAEVSFKTPDSRLYRKIPMRKEGAAYTGAVPGSETGDSGIEYYFTVTDERGGIVTLPTINPEGNPFFVFPADVTDDEVKWIEVLYPRPNDVITAVRPEISGLFLQKVDPRSVEIYLDDRAITDGSEIYSDYFVFFPAVPLKKGYHSLQVVVAHEDRMPLRKNWSFTVGDATPHPLRKCTGMLSAGLKTSAARKDSSDLEISYPAEGTFEEVDIYAMGQLKDYQLSIFLNHDRSIRTHPLWNFQLTGSGWNGRGGYIYPSISELVLNAPSVEGGMLSFHSDRTNISSFAGEIAITDIDFGEENATAAGGWISRRFGSWVPAVVCISEFRAEEKRLYSVGKNIAFKNDFPMGRLFTLTSEWALWHSGTEDMNLKRGGNDAFLIRLARSFGRYDTSLTYTDIGVDYLSLGSSIYSGRRGVEFSFSRSAYGTSPRMTSSAGVYDEGRKSAGEDRWDIYRAHIIGEVYLAPLRSIHGSLYGSSETGLFTTYMSVGFRSGTFYRRIEGSYTLTFSRYGTETVSHSACITVKRRLWADRLDMQWEVLGNHTGGDDTVGFQEVHLKSRAEYTLRKSSGIILEMEAVRKNDMVNSGYSYTQIAGNIAYSVRY
jgi:hypothetical protein